MVGSLMNHARSGIYSQFSGLYFDIDDELRVNYVSIERTHDGFLTFRSLAFG